MIGRLSALHQKRIDLGLERMHRLLERLGHPERKLPPVIHIAGTNGKGSTLAYLRATLEAAGLRVHAYTSPYLVRINECFRLGRVGGGVLVGDDELRAALEEVERVNAGEAATVFELKTAAAFHLFAQNPADVRAARGRPRRPARFDQCGRHAGGLRDHAGQHGSHGFPRRYADLDRRREGRDHQARRARDFAPSRRAEAMAVIEAQAKRMRAPLFAAGESWHVNVEHGRLVYSDDRGLMDLAAPRLFGRHQFDNAGLAIATLRAICRLSRSTRRRSRPASSAPNGRRGCSASPRASCSRCGPQGSEIWLDGGHNAEGGRVAAAALGDLEERVSRPLVVIAGMMANKDAQGFLANFAGLTRHIIAVPIPDTENAMPVDRLADAARSLGMRVEIAPGIEAALRGLAKLAYEVPPRILITGSLYLAGHVLGINGTPPA